MTYISCVQFKNLSRLVVTFCIRYLTRKHVLHQLYILLEPYIYSTLYAEIYTQSLTQTRQQHFKRDNTAYRCYTQWQTVLCLAAHMPRTYTLAVGKHGAQGHLGTTGR